VGLYIGVDEAGYGPLLGPLTIGATAFRLQPRTRWRAGLRARLGALVRQTPAAKEPWDAPLPVPIDDSKLVLRRCGLAGLARGVGTFAAAMDQTPPADLADLLFRFSDRQPDEFAGVPWFQSLESAALPLYPWAGPLHERFAEKNVEALDLRVLPVDAYELNAAFHEVGNKAGVLGILSGTLLTSILDRYPDEDALIVMDRHGARKDYTAYLSSLFPFARLDGCRAPPDESRYRVELAGRELLFRFVTKGDRVSLAVGWASMAAKLTRELFMRCFNEWFAARDPKLRPTAGYWSDGRRFLDDAAPIIADEAIERAALVRSR